MPLAGTRRRTPNLATAEEIAAEYRNGPLRVAVMGGYRMDAPGRHLRAKVVSTDHLRRRPWGRLTRSDWTLRSGFSRRTGQTRPAVWCSASAWCGRHLAPF